MLKFTCCDAVRQFSSQANAQVLRGIMRGLEKECLRVTATGELAQTPHQRALGSKLTHEWITTDYSEALLEFITPPSTDPDFPLAFLDEIHRFTVTAIGDELLWSASMPCVVGDDSSIPIADYGRSNKGHFKYVYREGLGHRYGRHMQTIAGVHYNWSLPDSFWQAMMTACGCGGMSLRDYKDAQYFALIRNYQRYSWLIPYLFGASPAICRSFVKGKKTELLEYSSRTLYGPHATSLRMSDIGYQNNAQAGLQVSFDNLRDYTEALERAIRTPDPFYAKLGVEVDGHWKQLNANLLQIENEFYAGIRPKHTPLNGYRPAKVLREYGVEYLEVRLFDLDPFSPLGVNADMMQFADVLLLMCLFRESPLITAREDAENKENRRRVVMQGRHPDLSLLVHNREHEFRTVANELFDDMESFAAMLDTAYDSRRYSETLQRLRQRIAEPEATPSAAMLRGAREHNGYFVYAHELAKQHKANLLARPLSADAQGRFQFEAKRSLAAQAEIEANDSGSFADYVARYYA